jgi:hypothetical protein
MSKDCGLYTFMFCEASCSLAMSMIDFYQQMWEKASENIDPLNEQKVE